MTVAATRAVPLTLEQWQTILQALEQYRDGADALEAHAEMVGNWGDASYWGGRLSDAADLVELVRLVVANV